MTRAARCNRCGAENGNRYSPFFKFGNVCTKCETELDCWAIVAAYPKSHHVRIDVLEAGLAERCATNTFEAAGEDDPTDRNCDGCGLREWDNQIYSEKEHSMRRLCDGCFSGEVAPFEEAACAL